MPAKTKPERRAVRVRHDPPTLPEAIAAAQGLTDRLDSQVEIAAALMNMAESEVRSEVLKARARVSAAASRLVESPTGSRSVLVEHKPRRGSAPPRRAGLS